MDSLNLFSFMFQLNDFLKYFISQYGSLIYILVSLAIFLETGLFIAFFPGDSLIFACAAFAAAGLLNVMYVVIICLISAFLGDSLNYYLGYAVGKKIYARANGWLLKRENIDKAKDFYDKHGGMAIVLSRFIPIVRQFTPFVSGIGKMTYKKFILFNVIGVILWVGLTSCAGYFFGNIPVVRDHFSTVIIAIIFVSLLPALIAFIKTRSSKQKPNHLH